MNVYGETSHELAPGDRLQSSALSNELGISNRDMGTITKMEPHHPAVPMVGKEQRSVSFDPAEFRQFDHGYAVTSHSSQGLTADRVIANIDSDSSRSLINKGLAYAAISRVSEDVRILTNNAETLGERLATEGTKTAALDLTLEQPEHAKAPIVQKGRSDSRVQQPGLKTCRRLQRVRQPPGTDSGRGARSRGARRAYPTHPW